MFLRKIFVAVMFLMTGALSAEVINVPLSSGQLIFIDGSPFIEGFNKLRIPGTPLLPAKSSLIALPPGSRITSIDIKNATPILMKKKELTIAPPSLPISYNSDVEDGAIKRWKNNMDALSSSEIIFPSKPIYCSKMSHFRNIPFVRLTYFPLLYGGDNLLFYPSSDVTIHYILEPAEEKVSEWVIKKASEYFSNWEEISNYYRVDTRADSFDYIILTKDNLFSAFDSLVNWKNSIGFSVKLVSIDSVVDHYPGTDIPDRIRNFLIDKYIPWGIHYLLLGGNIDIIPMKLCFPDPGHGSGYDTPTDYYFAELTDDWDSDNDGYYGEFGEDSIGFVPEVIVGRFPYNDGDTLGSICGKTVNFEKDTGNWKKNALLLAGFSNFTNEDSTGWPDCDGAALMETIKDSLLSGWTYTRMYEEAGLRPSIYPHEYAITEGNVVSVWSNGNYGITSWSGHGNPNGAYRKWWAWDDGDSIPEYDEMEWEAFIYITDAPLLDDTHSSIVFSASCSNAATEENIARALIANGASGIVAATNYGWYTPGWDDPSDGDVMSLNYYFYYYIIAQGKRVGDALFDTKVYYFNNLYFPDPWAPDPEWTPQQNQLDYTLFGDPSLVREGVGVQERPERKNIALKFTILPNLIHNQAEIGYSIPFEGRVDISLYNVSGQRVGLLYNGIKSAGFYKLPFKHLGLSAGLYFIKMKFEGNNRKARATEKIIIF